MNDLSNVAMIVATIIAMETKALEEWYKGNPAAYLDISAEDITYFDPATEKRIDGLENMKAYYEPVKGKIQVESYEIINPIVNVSGTMAVLSYNLASFDGKTTHKWNCTQVYRQDENDEQWKIVHNHWSLTESLKMGEN